MARKYGSTGRRLMVVLDRDLDDAFARWMVAENITSQSEALRSLMRIALAATPIEGSMYAARLRAFNEIRTWTLGRVMGSLAEIGQEVRQSIPTEATK